MIPKHIHQIWIGDTQLPRSMWTHAKEIRRRNPEYGYTLWDNNMVLDLAHKLPPLAKEKFDMFYNKKIWALATDIIRVLIIYKRGGIYLDTDFVHMPRGSFNKLPLADNDLILLNMLDKPNLVRFQNCFFAAAPRNMFMLHILRRIGRQKYTLTDLHGNPYEKYNTTFFTTEYRLFTKPKASNTKQFLWLTMDYTKTKKGHAIVPRNYFLGNAPLIAKHMEVRTHLSKNRWKYMSDYPMEYEI